MNVTRWFLVIAVLYLLVGMLLGSYMGGTRVYTLAPLHAHINLLGFVLPAVYAASYKQFGAMAEGMLPRAHFWLHQTGTLLMLVMLYASLSGRIAEDSALLVLFPLSEALIILGTAAFAWNVFRRAG